MFIAEIIKNMPIFLRNWAVFQAGQLLINVKNFFFSLIFMLGKFIEKEYRISLLDILKPFSEGIFQWLLFNFTETSFDPCNACFKLVCIWAF